MGSAADTRQRILRHARRLLNERGSRAVSTNHIAAAAGVSPGNLYYYFRNKEEIVREIHAAMAGRAVRFWRERQGRPATPRALQETLYLLQFFVWEYRFFRLEQNVLLAADPELHERHIVYHQERAVWLADFFASLEEAGVLKPLTPEIRAALMRSFWMIADYWIAALHAEGRALNRKNVRDGSLLLRTLFEPYVLKSARERKAPAAKKKARAAFKTNQPTRKKI
ncbi:MAG: TetR/AcrR family transcriptional regulator [Leptospirales bacterium]|jgi:AcrR family transcriptional regulator